jgi:hypothetical protein
MCAVPFSFSILSFDDAAPVALHRRPKINLLSMERGSVTRSNFRSKYAAQNISASPINHLPSPRRGKKDGG